MSQFLLSPQLEADICTLSELLFSGHLMCASNFHYRDFFKQPNLAETELYLPVSEVIEGWLNTNSSVVEHVCLARNSEIKERIFFRLRGGKA